MFVGYYPESKEYKLYNKREGKIVRSRNIVFLEENIKKNFALMPLTSSTNKEENESLNKTVNSEASPYESTSTMKENDRLQTIEDDVGDEEYVP